MRLPRYQWMDKRRMVKLIYSVLIEEAKSGKLSEARRATNHSRLFGGP